MSGVVGLEENEPPLPFSVSPFRSCPASVSIPHRRSFSYYRLPVHLLKLTILKLDGTSFDVHVSRTASVRELKMAVEGVFGQSQDGIKESISWTHVWGQFCLSYRGLKLIDEKALLKNFGIKDSDELHFMRHLSFSCAPAKHQQVCYATNTKWRRKSWSGPELIELEFEESAIEKRNEELIPVINENAIQSPDPQETIICGEEEHLILKNHQNSKLSHYFKGWLCYYNPIYILRASSWYRGC